MEIIDDDQIPIKRETSLIRSDRQKEHMNQEDQTLLPEIKNAFEIINNFANDPCDQEENNLAIALEQISMYLKSIQKELNTSVYLYESIIPSLVQIFLSLDDQSDKNIIFLDLFHQITTLLPNSKILEYFSNKELCDKLFNFISANSYFSNSSSRVVSHLIISNTITDFYDVPNFLNIAPFINNLSDRAFFLYVLPEINIPSELFFEYLQLVMDTFNLEDYETIEYGCQSLCNCIYDTLENEHYLPLDKLNDIFEPFLLSIQSEIPSFLTNRKIVKFIIELFECLFDNNICDQFFSNTEFVELLHQSSIEVLLLKNNEDGEYFFNTIFPFLSSIIKKNQISITQDLFTKVISIAIQGTFKVRVSAFLFISDVFDQIIMESPEFFEDLQFYELLIEMMSSSADDIMNQLIECISKLISSQVSFIDFIKELPNDSLDDFMRELDRIEDDSTDSDIGHNIIYIKKTLRQSLPRPYDLYNSIE